MSIIQFDSVSKLFYSRIQRERSFQGTLINWLHGRRRAASTEQLWALRDVSFSIEQGDTVALIGTNGSGKSTALKLITRIIYPTSGSIAVGGRVAALLELGAGFHPDLTGRDNIYLNGSILGMSRAHISHVLDDIVDFADLERFIDMPVRNYSSGMMMRLGFSVATSFQPEILLIDEVLAVGDQTFQVRCLHRIMDIQKDGATIVMVSHDLSTVDRFCRRAIWIDDGIVKADGVTRIVSNAYLGSVWQVEEQNPEPDGDRHQRWGSGEIRLEKAQILGADLVPCEVITTGSRFVVRMYYKASQAIRQASFGVSLYDEQGTRINGPNSTWGNASQDIEPGQGYVDYIVDKLPLLPGRYDLTVAIYDRYVAQPYDHWHRMADFTVIPTESERQDGLVFIPCSWDYHRLEMPISSETIGDQDV
jgi:ABC-type polysaccharide/polyol phosphate transport system ATPase subunit